MHPRADSTPPNTSTTTAPPPPIGQPAPPPQPDDLPHALTFFLSARERSAVLRALRAAHPSDRSRALLRALGIDARTTTTADAAHTRTAPRTPHHKEAP